MAVYRIPVSESPYQAFSVVLENNNYDVVIQWNTRDESWYISLARSGLVPLFKTKVVNGVDILRKYRAYEDCPKGSLFVYDLVKKFGRLQRDGFSSGRFALQYVDQFDRELIEDLRQ